jgi:NADPH:quinone reductase-like Zn-dependent oxidoreductase
MPTILDMDIAGEVHEVGPDIKNFQQGDRVLA